MGYEFPDVERAIVETIPDGVLWLQSTEDEVNHVYTVGGTETGPLRMDRVVVDTYATGRTAAKATAEQVRDILTAGPHFTTFGLLDRVEVEVVPHSVPWASDSVNLHQATYRVHTRAK